MIRTYEDFENRYHFRLPDVFKQNQIQSVEYKCLVYTVITRKGTQSRYIDSCPIMKYLKQLCGLKDLYSFSFNYRSERFYLIFDDLKLAYVHPDLYLLENANQQRIKTVPIENNYRKIADFLIDFSSVMALHPV